MAVAYVGLGANLGDREATLRGAVQRLRELGNSLRLSSVYETEPVGYLDQPPFLNAVAELITELSPAELLAELHAIERDFGRLRSFRNAPRGLDLDLLLYDDLIVATPELTVPHPRLHERAFVLVPLAELAGGLMHPVPGRTVAELLASVDAHKGVKWTAIALDEP